MKIETTKSDWYLIILFFVTAIPVGLGGYSFRDGYWMPVMDTLVYTIFTFVLTYIIVYRLFPVFFPKKQILRLLFWIIILMILFGFVELALYRLIEDRTLSDLKQYGVILWSICLLYTSPSPRDRTRSRMPSSA